MQYNVLKILKRSKIVAKIISIDFDGTTDYSILHDFRVSKLYCQPN